MDLNEGIAIPNGYRIQCQNCCKVLHKFTKDIIVGERLNIGFIEPEHGEEPLTVDSVANCPHCDVEWHNSLGQIHTLEGCWVPQIKGQYHTCNGHVRMK